MQTLMKYMKYSIVQVVFRKENFEKAVFESISRRQKACKITHRDMPNYSQTYNYMQVFCENWLKVAPRLNSIKIN